MPHQINTEMATQLAQDHARIATMLATIGIQIEPITYAELDIPRAQESVARARRLVETADADLPPVKVKLVQRALDAWLLGADMFRLHQELPLPHRAVVFGEALAEFATYLRRATAQRVS